MTTIFTPDDLLKRVLPENRHPPDHRPHVYANRRDCHANDNGTTTDREHDWYGLRIMYGPRGWQQMQTTMQM
jgi:hypothetical protein